MGTRMNRPVIPTAIKVAKGTLNVSRALKDEIQVTSLTELPEPPVPLTPRQQRMWDNLCTELKNNRILAKVDLDLVYSYVHNMDLFYICSETLKLEGLTQLSGNGIQIPHPLIGTMNNALKQAVSVGQLFGLTPSARTRISAGTGQEENPLLKLAKKIG